LPLLAADRFAASVTAAVFNPSSYELRSRVLLPVAIARGGQPEVVEEGVSGYLWEELAQLKARTLALTGDPALRRRLGEAARRRSERFSRPEFRRRLVAALEPIVRGLEEEARAPAGQ